MSSSSSSEHLVADRDEHLQLCDPVLWPPLLPSFLCFTRRFWNQIFTCFSDKFRYVAISMRLSLDRYMLEVNSRSSSKSCVLVKAVRMRLLLWSFPLLFSVEKSNITCYKTLSNKKNECLHLFKLASTHQWRCNETALGLEQCTQLGISPERGRDLRCLLWSVAWIERSGSTANQREKMKLWGAAVLEEKDEAGMRPCTAGRSTEVRLSWSGRSPAARADGATSALRKGTEVGYSRFPCRWPPSKSRNPREKTSACLQNLLLRVAVVCASMRRSVRQCALSGTVDSEVVLKAHGLALNSWRWSRFGHVTVTL